MYRLLFHLTVVVINLACICYDQMYIDLPMPSEAMKGLPFKSRIIFFTFWCAILQTLYQVIALLNDIMGTNAPEPKRPPTIRRIRDNLFPAVFSTQIYVSIAFWGVYLSVDKKMLEPLDVDKYYHPLMNHVLHSTGSLFVILELFTSAIDFPSRKVGFSILYTYLVSYVTWFFYIYFSTGNWVYPVCEHTTTRVVAVFIALGLALMGGLYVLGEKLNSIVCGNRSRYVTNAQKSKRK